METSSCHVETSHISTTLKATDSNYGRHWAKGQNNLKEEAGVALFFALAHLIRRRKLRLTIASVAKKHWATLVFIILCPFMGVLAYSHLDYELTDTDNYYSWVEGTRIVNGENPYSRIHQSDMVSNDKYATYFPLFYELSALVIFLGLDQFPEWVEFWRAVFLLANFAVGYLMFSLFDKKAAPLLGLLAVALWFFNRWTLLVVDVVNLDVFAILPFLIALYIFPNRWRASLIIFSLSLALKQIAIFVAPLFLIWTYKEYKNKPWPRVAEALGLIASLPLLSSLPFLFSDPLGLIKSTLFSVTRAPTPSLRALDLSNYLGLTGIVARLPLLILLLVFLVIAWKTNIPKYVSAFLIMFAFVEFNPVGFSQYMVWFVCLLPFVLFEITDVYTNKPQKIRA